MVLERMRELDAEAAVLAVKFKGLELMELLFPQEYAQLDPQTPLDKSNLLQIDRQFVSLLNQYCFPCYADCQIPTQYRGGNYYGIREIDLVTIGYDPYQYWKWETSWDYVYSYLANDCDLIPEWLDLDRVGESVREFRGHPLEFFPEVLAWTGRMTGNVWLDNPVSEGIVEAPSPGNIEYLKKEYIKAERIFDRLMVFNGWFRDNRAVAEELIDKILNRIYGC